MIQFTDVTGLIGNALAIVVVASAVLGALRVSRQQMGWWLAAIFLAALLPLAPLPLAAYLRGAIGDLSIASLVLLSAALLRSLRGWPVLPGRNQLLLFVIIAAAGFYPLALGWGAYDPYRLGYGSYWLLAYLLGLVSLAVLKGFPAVACTIALSVLAWSAGWYESTNLWDYLLDPLVSIYAVAALTTQAIRTRRALKQARQIAPGKS